MFSLQPKSQLISRLHNAMINQKNWKGFHMGTISHLSILNTAKFQLHHGTFLAYFRKKAKRDYKKPKVKYKSSCFAKQ